MSDVKDSPEFREQVARREQAERRAGEMEARYDRLTLTVAQLTDEIAALKAAARWWDMFAKYAAHVEECEGVYFTHREYFTPNEWGGIAGLPGMEWLAKERP